jgi:ubiquinone/menaquinone biosynthesis C-methylase UbiE
MSTIPVALHPAGGTDRPAARNHWLEEKCAKAFWSQQEVRPYQQLLSDTVAWCNPTPGERWLDLGCGSGPLTRALWLESRGTVAKVCGIDCARVNERAYANLRRDLSPRPGEQIGFICHNFSQGLDLFPDCSFDHAVSGLSISYAESFSQSLGRWTDEAYARILGEVYRVIRPGGRFVFSVNVPEPKWWRVAVSSLGRLAHTGRPILFLKRAMRMMKYGEWLKREARTGRFHYLPASEVTAKLVSVGFEGVEYRMSYSRQAFIFRAHKPAQ